MTIVEVFGIGFFWRVASRLLTTEGFDWCLIEQMYVADWEQRLTCVELHLHKSFSMQIYRFWMAVRRLQATKPSFEWLYIGFEFAYSNFLWLLLNMSLSHDRTHVRTPSTAGVFCIFFTVWPLRFNWSRGYKASLIIRILAIVKLPSEWLVSGAAAEGKRKSNRPCSFSIVCDYLLQNCKVISDLTIGSF